MFISFLDMIQETMCPSSVEKTASLRHLVFVTLCGWLSADSHPHWHIPSVTEIQLYLLMMGTQSPESCREKK